MDDTLLLIKPEQRREYLERLFDKSGQDYHEAKAYGQEHDMPFKEAYNKIVRLGMTDEERHYFMKYLG